MPQEKQKSFILGFLLGKLYQCTFFLFLGIYKGGLKKKGSHIMSNKKILFTLIIFASCSNFSKDAFCGHRKPVFEFPETPLNRTATATTVKEIVLPDKHRIKTPSVKNQDPLGTCSIFTATGLYETYHPHQKASEAEFSVYAETQIGDCVSGINLGNTLDLAQKDGFMLEQDAFSYKKVYVPYVAAKNGIDIHDSDWDQQVRNIKPQSICSWNRDKAKAYNDTMMKIGVSLRLKGHSGSTSYRLGKKYWLHHVSHDDLERALASKTTQNQTSKQEGSIGAPAHTNLHKIKLALAHGFPVAVAADVYDNCWLPEKKGNYTIRMPSSEDERQGSHAFMITGYDGDNFLLRNSWGSQWAYNGYAWLPGKYLQKYATEVVAVGK